MKKENQRTLVVVLHAYNGSPRRMRDIEQLISDQWRNSRIYIPKLPVGLFSTQDPNKIINNLLDDIDQFVDKSKQYDNEYDDIVFVGHSVGALFARKLYVVACGETADAPFEPVYKSTLSAQNTMLPPRAWVNKVSRLVLLAGMNRGWRITHHLNFSHLFTWSVGALFGKVLYYVTFKKCLLLILNIRCGAEFITQLRIQWLMMRRRVSQQMNAIKINTQSHAGHALTVQLLGSCDDMVAPTDNIDLVSGGDFIYLDVPYSGHRNVVEFNDPVHGEGRKSVFMHALTSTHEQLQSLAVVPSDEDFIKPVIDTEKVVFVIHGIRDNGYWTHKVARRIKQRLGDHQHWATETSSYGYFPMLPFLLPGFRRKKVEWLMDQYAEALARYPNATFSYVGHSNGTYLLAKALELYPCCRFEHVVFAGSVVRTNYDWVRYMQEGTRQVKAVFNIVASHDWVVAFFPKFFQTPLPIQDLGSAGHDGFKVKPGANLYQAKLVKGDHGAGVKEPMWDKIADFIIHGEVTLDTFPNKIARRGIPGIIVKLLGFFPPFVLGFLAFLLVSMWFCIIRLIDCSVADIELSAYYKSAATACYLLMIWLFVTRV